MRARARCFRRVLAGGRCTEKGAKALLPCLAHWRALANGQRVAALGDVTGYARLRMTNGWLSTDCPSPAVTS